jgi:uncharacterized protein (TIGR00725 family)
MRTPSSDRQRRVYVAVCGAGNADEATKLTAERLGRLLAQAGAVVICGGLGGVMEAACRGASEAGGTSIGLLPGRDRAAANRYVTYAIATGLGEARNALVVRAADVVVAVGGEYGTLSEIAFALKIGVPVVAIASWRVARDADTTDPIERAIDASDAATRALRHGDRRRGAGQ